MKKVIPFIFLFIYVLNQAAFAMPALNSYMDNYEIRKKCKYGRKDKQFKVNDTQDFIYDDDQSSSEKKSISFCYSDVQFLEEKYFYFIPLIKKTHTSFFKPSLIYSLRNIHSPPPCFI